MKKTILILVVLIATLSSTAQPIPNIGGDERLDQLFDYLESIGVEIQTFEANDVCPMLDRSARFYSRNLLQNISPGSEHYKSFAERQKESDERRAAAVDRIVRTIESLDWGDNPEGLCRSNPGRTILHCYSLARDLADGRKEQLVFQYSKDEKNDTEQGSLVHRVNSPSLGKNLPFDSQSLGEGIVKMMADEGIKSDTLNWTHGKHKDPSEKYLMAKPVSTPDGLSYECSAKAKVFTFEPEQGEMADRLLAKVSETTHRFVTEHPTQQFSFFYGAKFLQGNIFNLLQANNGQGENLYDSQFCIFTYTKGLRRKIILLNTEGTIYIPRNIFD